MGDYINRIPIYYPPGYNSFNSLPDGYDPFKCPSPDAKPTNWLINLAGGYLTPRIPMIIL